MLNIFKPSKEKKLTNQYNKLLKEAYQLSKVNRKLSDQKYAEAERLMQENKDVFT